jgi:sugar lactone lactonase YvrE
MSGLRTIVIVIGIADLVIFVVGIVYLAVAYRSRVRPIFGIESGPVLLAHSEAPVPVNTVEKYGLVATLDVQVKKLKGIALGAEDNLYAAGADGVKVWTADGKLLREWRTSGPATCIALGGDGNVYVGQQTKVEVFDPEGKPLRSWGTEGLGPGELNWVTGIAIFQANVLVADAGDRCIHRFDTTGDFIADIGKRDPEAGLDGIICPSPYLGLAVDKAGMIYVTNPGMTRVERYSLDGKLLGFRGEGGSQPQQFSGCCNPTNVALFGDGRIVTAEKITPRVKVYDAQGAMRAFIGPEYFTKEAAGLGLAIDSAGRLFVMDPGDGKVRIFQQKK